MCFCFFIDRRQQPYIFNLIFEILKWSLLLGIISALVIASLKSTDDDSLILRLLRPLLIEGYRIAYKLITNPYFYTPLIVFGVIGVVVVLAMNAGHIIEGLIACFYCVQGKPNPNQRSSADPHSSDPDHEMGTRTNSQDNPPPNPHDPNGPQLFRPSHDQDGRIEGPYPTAPGESTLNNPNHKNNNGYNRSNNSSSSGIGSNNNSINKTALPGYNTVTGNPGTQNAANNANPNPNWASPSNRLTNPLYGYGNEGSNSFIPGYGTGTLGPTDTNNHQNANQKRPSPSILVPPNTGSNYPNYRSNQSNTLGRNPNQTSPRTVQPNFINPYDNSMRRGQNRNEKEKLLEHY